MIYSGSKKFTDKISVKYNYNGKEISEDISAGKLVLSPTRTYTPVFKKIFSENKSAIHGLVHCSGGGQTKILNFINDLHIIKDDLFPVPPLFKMIKEESKTDMKEMYKVYNMGHRMEIYCKKEDASSMIEIAKSFNVEAKIIGRCESYKGKKLSIVTSEGVLEY